MYVPMFAAPSDGGGIGRSTPTSHTFPRRPSSNEASPNHPKQSIVYSSTNPCAPLTPDTIASPQPPIANTFYDHVNTQNIAPPPCYGQEAPRTPPIKYVNTPPATTTYIQPSAYQTVYTPRDIISQQHAWTVGNRSITPPPSLIASPVVATTTAGSGTQGSATSDEWVSISTANMSPFTILRIKALIELSGITDDYQYNVRTIGAASAAKCPSRLRCRSNTPVEYPDGHVPPQWWISQLNELIVASGPKNRGENLARVNMQLQAEKHQLKIDEDASRNSKLSFNPGAALICFDPKEKPRRIKDNHKKHFKEFLEQQQQQQQAGDFFRTD